jgi:AcrR family transcriptional regulator
MSAVAKRRRVIKPAAKRREEIVAAALRLFQDKGFEATTVQDIAEAAEVAAGTVYLYFSSKGDILRGIHEVFHEGMHHRLEQVSEQLLEGLQDGTVAYATAIDQSIDATAEYMLDHRAETTVICRYLHDLHEPFAEERRFVDFVAATIAAARDTGQVHTTDPEMTAHLLVAAIRGPFTQAIVHGYPADMERLVAQAKELFRKALATSWLQNDETSGRNANAFTR